MDKVYVFLLKKYQLAHRCVLGSAIGLASDDAIRMPYPLFKTEIDAAKVLLRAGWRPNDINGILQFPLSEQTFCSLGAKSLFFLVNDPLLAEDTAPGAKQAATAVLTAQGWTEIEISVLLKPHRAFAPQDYEDFERNFEPDRFEASPVMASADLLPMLDNSPLPSVPPWRGDLPLRRERRSAGFNRLLGLGLVIISVGLFVLVLP